MPALISTGAITAYSRRYFRTKRRTACPAFLKAKHNVPLLLALGFLLFQSVTTVQWPLPDFVGWVLIKVCLAALNVAAVVEMVLVFRSDAPDRWSRSVLGLVKGEVLLDEEDMLLDAKDEEEQAHGLDEKFSGLDVKVADVPGVEPSVVTGPQVDLPAMPMPAVLSEVRDTPGGRRS